MAGPFIFTGTYHIREGQLERAKAALADLTKHVQENEPRLHHFGFYFDDDNNAVTCMQVHPDAASMELHLKVIAGHLEGADEFLDFSQMQTRAYGDMPADLLATLREWDGDALRVAAPLCGFERLPDD